MTIKNNLKVTWDDVYQDFRRRHPNLSKTIYGYVPYGYATIIMYSPSIESHLIYNYDDSRAYIISEEELIKRRN